MTRDFLKKFFVRKEKIHSPTYANKDVLNFYKTMPFNWTSSVDNEVLEIQNRQPKDLYPELPELLRPSGDVIVSETTVQNPEKSVLEVGCGTGWLSNSITYLYNSSVLGIDFNPVVIKRAQEVAKRMMLNTRFQCADLFLFKPEEKFDIVLSFGVLHHTDNCEYAIKYICENFVKSDGHVMIGLYHKYGRKPFLDYFQEMKNRGASEDEIFDCFRALNPSITDESLLLSWFRDQVIHPHETQHTLEEILPILEGSDMDLISTSINFFNTTDEIDDVIKKEKAFENLAMERLKSGEYYPGFFMFLAKKRGS